MMKKMVMLVVISTLSIRAMEQENKENKWTVTAYGTKINLYKEDNMLDYYADGQNKVDFIVVGKNIQGFKFYQIEPTYYVGHCWKCSDVFFVPKKNKDKYLIKYSYDEEREKRVDVGCHFPYREDYNVCINIVEPYVYVWRNGVTEKYTYNLSRLINLKEIDCGYYEGFQAIQRALEDVEICYATVLAYIAKQNNKALAKTVALPTLGVEKYTFNVLPKDKAAPIAIKAILEYIKNNPKAYDCMELFVEEDFEFDLYQELLMQWRGRRNLFWLSFAQKDFKNMSSTLLPEVIDYIAKLI